MTRRYRILMTICFITSIIYFLILNPTTLFHLSSAEQTTYEHRKLCQTSYDKTSIYNSIQNEDLSLLTTIYVITPTYFRPEMLAELTRIGQTLLLVPKIHWIVAEDTRTCSDIISKFLLNLGIPFTHISSPMPRQYRHKMYIPRGVANRRAALDWIRIHAEDNSVLYFLDDDNAVDIRLFEEMRPTAKVSMWPVGLVGEYSVSSPILNKNGEVIGFYDHWPAERKFQVDMAGFAVNVEFFKKQKNAAMPYITGHEEDGFLKSLQLELGDIEPKANDCKDILVWHTRAKKNPVRSINLKSHSSDNIGILGNFMKSWGIIK